MKDLFAKINADVPPPKKKEQTSQKPGRLRRL